MAHAEQAFVAAELVADKTIHPSAEDQQITHPSHLSIRNDKVLYVISSIVRVFAIMAQNSRFYGQALLGLFWAFLVFSVWSQIVQVRASGYDLWKSSSEDTLGILQEENARLRNEARMLLNRLNHFDKTRTRQTLVSHGDLHAVYRYGPFFNTTVRATASSGSAASSVIECAATERVLYRFFCPADVVAATTMTGVIDC
jgi:hypothetical protein